MLLPPGTLTTADSVLKAIGGIGALLTDATQTEEPKTLAWFSTRVGSKLVRLRKTATSIAGIEAARLAHEAYVERLAATTE